MDALYHRHRFELIGSFIHSVTQCSSFSRVILWARFKFHSMRPASLSEKIEGRIFLLQVICHFCKQRFIRQFVNKLQLLRTLIKLILIFSHRQLVLVHQYSIIVIWQNKFMAGILIIILIILLCTASLDNMIMIGCHLRRMLLLLPSFEVRVFRHFVWALSCSLSSRGAVLPSSTFHTRRKK